MPLLLVLVKYGLYLLVQRFICFFELGGDILVNGAFAYPELLCSGSYCRVIFNNIFSEYYASFLITFAAWFQRLFPPHVNYNK